MSTCAHLSTVIFFYFSFSFYKTHGGGGSGGSGAAALLCACPSCSACRASVSAARATRDRRSVFLGRTKGATQQAVGLPRILLCMCPHTTADVSAYCNVCVLIPLYMCPHAAVYVSDNSTCAWYR